jgi:hypothetical protein
MEKKELLRHLNETYQQSLALLQTVDPLRVVYEETGWRVKDIVGHVATWDAETLRSLHAFRRGGAYTIPNYVGADDFNGYAATARMDEPFAQILADWDATRRWMLIIFNAMSDDDFSAEMTYPDGERGSIRLLVQSIFEHEAEHMEQIRAAAAVR